MSQVTVDQALQIAFQHHQAGQFPQAEGIYRQILAHNPNHADVLFLLGTLASQVQRFDVAIDLIRRAIALGFNTPEAHNNLGNALFQRGELDASAAACRQAIALRPNYAEGYSNLANALWKKGELDAAIAACRQAIALRPDLPEAHSNLGNALTEKMEYDGAIAAYRRAIALRPNYAEAYSNLVGALKNKGELDAAVAASRQAIALQPNHAEAHNNLGVTLAEMGQLDEALQCFRTAISLNPDYARAHSYLLLFLNCHPDSTPESILRESLRWAARHAEPLKSSIQPHGNSRDPDRRLRIGYVSPDLREHAVGRFLLPLLAEIDRGRFETFCYADVPAPDAMTAQLAAHADGWRNIVGLTDPQAAELIRKDQIDILIDLALHSARNRLRVFARKPAPVQATYLAYCSTSGMSAMDWRITDPYLDPPGEHDAYYTERSIHLPQTYWCYHPGVEKIEPNPLPALGAGHITFGSLNVLCKATKPALQTWCRLLRDIPQSELILHAKQGSHRQRLLDFFAAEGIDPRRVRFMGHVPIADYFAMYHSIDIALDPFPYAGGTTTCDALWMGVPMVSLAGRLGISRGGLSILSNMGLPQWVAHDPQEYVNIAMDLASDLPRLAEWRATLRGRMEQSPLMDAKAFTRSMETAYRTMWRQWCGDVTSKETCKNNSAV